MNLINDLYSFVFLLKTSRINFTLEYEEITIEFKNTYDQSIYYLKCSHTIKMVSEHFDTGVLSCTYFDFQDTFISYSIVIPCLKLLLFHNNKNNIVGQMIGLLFSSVFKDKLIGTKTYQNVLQYMDQLK